MSLDGNLVLPGTDIVSIATDLNALLAVVENNAYPLFSCDISYRSSLVLDENFLY